MLCICGTMSRLKVILLFLSKMLVHSHKPGETETTTPRPTLESSSSDMRNNESEQQQQQQQEWLQPLKYEPLARAAATFPPKGENDEHASSSLGVPSSSLSSDDHEGAISEITLKLHDMMYSKEWLLEDNQHFNFPKYFSDHHIVQDETKPIFSISDFVREQQQRVLQDVILSSSSNNKILSSDQFVELKYTGRLSVPSYYFQDQYHVWEIHPSFYSGTRTAQKRFQKGLGCALDHIVVWTQDAIISSSNNDDNRQQRGPSLYGSFVNGFGRSFLHVGKCLRDLFLGNRKTLLDNYQIEEVLTHAQFWYTHYHMNQIQPGYYCSTVGVGDDCHYGSSHWKLLKDDDVWKDNTTYIPNDEDNYKTILNEYKHARQKIDQHHQKVMRDMEVLKTDEIDINETLMRESPLAAINENQRAHQQWDQKVQKDLIKTLQSSDDVILQAEGNRMKVESVRQKIVHEDEIEQKRLLKEFEQNLQKKRPIMSLSSLWMGRRKGTYQREIRNDQKQSRNGRLFKQLKLENESSNSAIDDVKMLTAPLEFETKFREEEAPKIQQALEKKRSKHPPAIFMILKLNSKKWFQDDDHGRYRTVEVDRNENAIIWRTKYFWYTFCSVGTSLGGSAFHFLINGPLSLRALFSLSPFYAYQMCRNNNGDGGKEIVDDPSSITPTFVSRLQSFYRDLRSIRQEFEREPDVGLVGKSIQRMFLRCYLGMKAVIGTVAITSCMVVGTLVSTAITSISLLLSPILAGICTVVLAAFTLVIYDTIISDPDWSPTLKILVGVPYYIIVPGICQFLIATGLVIIHPLIGMILLFWSSLRIGWTSTRDAITWQLIRRNAKIPAGDTFLAKRIMGPGLSSQYFYRLPKRQALLAMQAFLEYYRINAYGAYRQVEVLAPFKNFHSIVDKVVRPFGFETRNTSIGPEEIETRILRILISKPFKNFMWQKESPIRSCGDFVNGGFYGGFWSNLAARIRQAHPTYASKQRFQSKADGMQKSFALYDKEVLTRLDEAVVTIQEDSRSTNPTLYSVMYIRAGKMLCELRLRNSYREQRLIDICAIPEDGRSMFRLPKDDLQDLWKSALLLTAQYAAVIREELLGMADASPTEFRDELMLVANKLADGFWTNAGGARAGKDVEIVASHILSLVFGGKMMLEPMEDVDEKIMLVPRYSPEDAHMDFLGQRQHLPPDHTFIDPEKGSSIYVKLVE